MALTESTGLSNGGVLVEQTLWEELQHGLWLGQEQAQVVTGRGRLWEARAVGQVPDPPLTVT